MVHSQMFQKLLFLLPFAYPRPPTTTQAGGDWSYDDPADWSTNYPTCGGNRQSPIHLRTSTTYILPIPPIKFQNYDIALTGPITLSNNGHSAEFAVPNTVNGLQPSISGATLKNKYEAVGVHFHWGSGVSKGSEHVINNRRFDVEMHIVHKNINYATVDEAKQHSDGLAVLGVMFKSTKVIDRFYPGLNKIFNRLPEIVDYHSSTTIQGQITLGQLLGDLNTKKFFTYKGSLTTPDCAEAVIWHVFPEPLPVAEEQIEKLWSLTDSHDAIMVNNYRPLQSRNARPIFYRVGVSSYF